MIEIFLIILALIWLIFAVISDLKTTEIPNWLNFSLIIFALGARFFYSLFNNFDWNFFIQGVFGFAVFFILADMFYYGRFFGGGDAKLLKALGPILPLGISFISNIGLFLTFLFLFLLAGAGYGLILFGILSTNNFNKLKREFLKQNRKNKKTIIAFLILGIILIAAGYYFSYLFILGIFILISPYLVIYAQSVDESCMKKRIKTSELTEGDWLHQDIRVGKNIIKKEWDGLSKKEIAILRKKYKFVMIKKGIEFSPVFLISFLIYIYLYFMKINLWDSLW